MAPATLIPELPEMLFERETRKPGLVVIWTDGACKGNPGPGGWAVRLEAEFEQDGKMFGFTKLKWGSWKGETTNNRMELQAAIEGLKALTKLNREVVIVSDSEYLVKGATEWLPRWKANGWTTSEDKEVANRDLWVQLELLMAQHRVSLVHVAGHSGIMANEQVNLMAQKHCIGDGKTEEAAPTVRKYTSGGKRGRGRAA